MGSSPQKGLCKGAFHLNSETFDLKPKARNLKTSGKELQSVQSYSMRFRV